MANNTLEVTWTSSELNSSSAASTATLATTTAAPLRVTEVMISSIHDGIPQSVWIAFEIVHIILTVLALLGNCVSLTMIYGVVPRLTPPLQLLTSLAFVDMLAPWAVMTLYFPRSSCQDEIHSALLLTAHNSGCVTLMGLAMCHNVATFRPFHYEKIASQKRIWIFINVAWIIGILTAHVHFLATLTHLQERGPYCLQVQDNLSLALTLAATLCGATLVLTGLIYGRIMLHLRPIQALNGEEGSQPRKSIRGILTGILLVGCYALGWVPYLINKFEHAEKYYKTPEDILVGLDVCQVFILLACIAHPIIYGVRMTCMQNAYHKVYLRARGFIVAIWSRVTKGISEGDEQPSTPLNPIESIC